MFQLWHVGALREGLSLEGQKTKAEDRRAERRGDAGKEGRCNKEVGKLQGWSSSSFQRLTPIGMSGAAHVGYTAAERVLS